MSTKEQDDLKFVTDNAGKVYKTLADFKTRNQKTLDEWQNLETAWEAHKVGIVDIAEDIEKDGLIYENDQLEIWKKESRITVMPKDRYKNK
jgi:23S rRNA-/tRNA-specific pseudouridylate synthase